jgi:hypothetical protein
VGARHLPRSCAEEDSVADLSRSELQRLARLGAQARLEELRQEEAAIRAAFPDLFRGGPRRGRRPGRAGGADQDAEANSASGTRRRRRTMSPAQRRAVSERMKRYWAARRRSKKSA